MNAQLHRRVSHLGRWLPDAATLGDYRTFFTTAVRNPTLLGAATPTSRAVGEAVAQVVPTTGAPVVVELGPGTGSLSGPIHDRLPEGARHIGIELADSLVEHLRIHRPWLEVVHGNAADAVALLDKLGVDQVDAVISSIPWSLLAPDEQNHVLRQATELMKPHGVFTALTYHPPGRTAGGRHFRRHLSETFDEVLTHTTWRNLPPILHYICRRPLRLSS